MHGADDGACLSRHVAGKIGVDDILSHPSPPRALPGRARSPSTTATRAGSELASRSARRRYNVSRASVVSRKTRVV